MGSIYWGGLRFWPWLPSIQFSSVMQSCRTLHDPMNHRMPGLPVHHQLPEFTQTHVHWVSDAIQPSHLLSSPSPPAPNPSQHQGLFQWVNSLHEVAKVLEFRFSISPSNEHPGLISFRMDLLDVLAVQGTLKSLFQHHSSKASILWCSALVSVFLFHGCSHHLQWLLSPPNKVFHCFSNYLPWIDGTKCCNLSFLNVEL